MITRKIKKGLKVLLTEGPATLWHGITISLTSPLKKQYRQWLKENPPLAEGDLARLRDEAAALELKPLFSIATPVYNVDEVWLSKCIDSVLAQVYPEWELCLVDDASTQPHVRRVLESYQARDKRIRVEFLNENRGIAGATNAALQMAKGDYIGLLDNDDELTPDALFEVAKLINVHPDADMIYSDEDKLSEGGELTEPFFKPGWSPDLLLSQMYSCHFGVYRKSIIDEIGGFREGFDGSQDYDLVLRFTERTGKVYHIPRVLYHWRIIPGSTAEKYESKDSDVPSLKALRHAMARRSWNGVVEKGLKPGTFRLRRCVSDGVKVSIIIPTRDQAELLKKCITSIRKKTTWPNYEILVVDNESSEPAALDYLKQVGSMEGCRVISFTGAFNFSAINNAAAKDAAGDVLVFLNNDTEVETGDWLEAMLEVATRDDVGAAGPMLLYPDDTIQHAGVVMGLGGIANPAFYRRDYEGWTYFNQAEVIRNYSAVTGACMMVRKAVFEEMGGFDEQNCPIAYQDIDLCLRMGEKGYLSVYTPFAILYHHEAASRGYREDPEAEYMIKRWRHIIDNDPYYNPNLTRDKFDFSLKLKN